MQFVLGSSEFEVDVRYMNLKPIGRGAYGLVAAADDLVCDWCWSFFLGFIFFFALCWFSARAVLDARACAAALR